MVERIVIIFGFKYNCDIFEMVVVEVNNFVVWRLYVGIDG